MAREPSRPCRPRDRAPIQSGEGEAEGFELSRQTSSPGDEHSTQPIRRDAAGFDEPEIPRLDDDRYGAGVDEDPET